MWQHRDDGANQVSAVCAFLSFDVERCAWLDVGTDVSDVHANADIAVV